MISLFFLPAKVFSTAAAADKLEQQAAVTIRRRDQSLPKCLRFVCETFSRTNVRFGQSEDSLVAPPSSPRHLQCLYMRGIKQRTPKSLAPVRFSATVMSHQNIANFGKMKRDFF
ncbi:hypothetical protein ElyMa_003330300 [Elysia marginata]|uniref:Secreted protein n=1 Tax=Elysia marginata TaxID=1093978 RepID=A0AAV4JE52_9GAST|nr:hypothetical protein ElyMa_003330300 [Elysia marginata]